jgi:hypothetical protein
MICIWVRIDHIVDQVRAIMASDMLDDCLSTFLRAAIDHQCSPAPIVTDKSSDDCVTTALAIPDRKEFQLI